MALTKQTSVVIALGSAQTLAWGSTYYLPAILAAPMARELGASTSLVFGAFSVALVVAAVLGPLAGRRIDLFGGRDVLAFSSLIFAAGLATLGMARGAGMLFAGWLVIGIGMAMGLYEAAFSTLAGIYGRKARGPITGITLLAGLASTICWPISAYLEAELGWRMACLIWASAHILIGLPLNRFLVPLGTQSIPSATNEAAQAARRQVHWAAEPRNGVARPRLRGDMVHEHGDGRAPAAAPRGGWRVSDRGDRGRRSGGPGAGSGTSCRVRRSSAVPSAAVGAARSHGASAGRTRRHGVRRAGRHGLPPSCTAQATALGRSPRGRCRWRSSVPPVTACAKAF